MSPRILRVIAAVVGCSNTLAASASSLLVAVRPEVVDAHIRAIRLRRPTTRGDRGPVRSSDVVGAFRREPVAAKVPEIGVLFWVIKVLTTGMGEAASDYLGGLNLLLAGAVGVLGFGFAMWL